MPKFQFALREDLKEKKEFLPTRAETTATGWDVKAAQKDMQPITLRPFQKILIPLGFRAFCPKGYWLKLNPRSSTFAKKNLSCLYGVIDESFEGELHLAVQYIPELTLKQIYEKIKGLLGFLFTPELKISFDASELVINFGDNLGQLIPVKRNEMSVEEISNEAYDIKCAGRGAGRGAGGFGSTDKKEIKTGFIKYGKK
jgi:dUTPase